jgi:hypothetical protein
MLGYCNRLNNCATKSKYMTSTGDPWSTTFQTQNRNLFRSNTEESSQVWSSLTTSAPLQTAKSAAKGTSFTTRLIVSGPCYQPIFMKRATAWNRSTMKHCNMWFPHNEIVAPYVSMNMLWIRSLSGNWFCVEVQAEWVLTGEQRNLWQQHCRGMLHSKVGVLEALWDMAVVEDLWCILAAQHTILGAHHASELCSYVEHKWCSMKTTWRTWYQIQMLKCYPINRPLKHENFGAHSCEQNLKT